jgi:hypothetical protein
MPTVICGLGLLAIYALFFKPLWRNGALINFIAATGTAGLYFLFFLANGRTSSQINSMYPFGFARQLAGDLVSVNDASFRIIASLIYTSIYLVLPIVGAISFLLLFRKTVSPLLIFSIPAVPILIITALFGGQDSSGYFVKSCLGLLNIVLLVCISRYFSSHKLIMFRQSSILLLTVTSGVAGIIAHQLISRFNGGSQNEVLIRSLLLSHWLVALVLALIWYPFQQLFKASIKHTFVIGFIVAELSCFAGVELMMLDRLTKGAELTSAESFVALGTKDEMSVGKWIRQHTPPHALVATNHFCGAQCTGPNWFENDYKNLDDTYNYPPSSTGYGGFDFILSDYAERRFLIEGSRFLLVNGMPREEVRERMKLVLDFANAPNAETIQSLKDVGVSYFVLEKNATQAKLFNQETTIVYENLNYLVLLFN